MFIQKLGSALTQTIQARQLKKAKKEELAQDMATWLPPEGYGSFGKIGKRAVQIIKEREKDAQILAKKNEEGSSKMLSGAFMDLLR